MKPWKSKGGFAGAASGAMLEWGHGDEAVEEPESIARTPGRKGFNGATAMKPWKSPDPERRQTVSEASMGPRR